VSPDRPVAYVLGTFPQASQTFIAREVRGLRQRGIPLLVFALARRPASLLEEADRAWYPLVRFAPLAAAPSVLAANASWLRRVPARYLRAFARVVSLPHRPRYLALRAVALFMTGAWIAREIERAGGCRQVHAHFALAQTEVALVVSELLGCPFSFTAHARDIYATPSALEEKIRAAAVVVTCTAYNVEHLRALCPDVDADRIRLVHHGVDVDAASRVVRAPDADAARPLLLAAGRLIEKKGFDTLIAACAELRRRGVAFRCAICGSGPLLGALQKQVASMGLADVVDLPGWTPPGALLDRMSGAAAFVMPSRVSRGGDRDGIPNVILEAMAAGLPVIATGVSGIPEAVAHGVTGLLIDPDNPLALADAVERLLATPGLRTSYGDAARTRIHEEFALERASARLASVFGFGGTPA
jgi:glycosyltransferase involved in cell wall biosynthesis